MVNAVQVYGRKKTATAVAHVRSGTGIIKLNGVPLELVEPELLRFKVFEPLLLLGRKRFELVDFSVRIRGGGQVARIYGITSLPPTIYCSLLIGLFHLAARQAIAKGLVAYYQKCKLLIATFFYLGFP